MTCGEEGRSGHGEPFLLLRTGSVQESLFNKNNGLQPLVLQQSFFG
jgi:hypothetical protein